MRFDMFCEANGIEHRLTKPNHLWTMAGRADASRCLLANTCQPTEQNDQGRGGQTVSLWLRAHLADFLAAYNFARRLKTLNSLKPYAYICKISASDPDRFIL